MRTTRLMAVPFALALALTTVALTGPATAAAERVSGAEIVLKNADNNRAVTVDKGDTVRVELTGTRNSRVMWAWNRPMSDDEWVLTTGGSYTLPDGNAAGIFWANDPGTTTVHTYQVCVPVAPDTFCPQVVLPWKVTVVVK